MFFHFHPYNPYINDDTIYLIVGTLPPPRFCKKELKINDVNFCYGSQDNQLWQVLNKIFNLNLLFDNSQEAITQRMDFLNLYKIGICDIVESCKRDKIDASDLGMKDIILRDLISYIKKYPNIQRIIFTGKSSKNSPEYFFKKQLSSYKHHIQLIENSYIKEHKLSIFDRNLTLYSLTSPSNAANRSIGANEIFKKKKLKNKDYSTFDFRYEEYKIAFTINE